MLIPQHIFPIHKVCDVKSTRYALDAVKIERETPESQPRAVVTDGRRLVTVTWDDSDSKDFPGIDARPKEEDEFSALIPKKAWQEAAKLAPKRSPKSVLMNVALNEKHDNPDIVQFVGTDLETTRKLEPRQVEGRFPKWQDVIPKYSALARYGETSIDSIEGRAVRISLDAKFLAELAEIVHTCGAEEGSGIDLVVPLEYGRGILLESGQCQAVLMPLTPEK